MSFHTKNRSKQVKNVCETVSKTFVKTPGLILHFATGVVIRDSGIESGIEYPLCEKYWNQYEGKARNQGGLPHDKNLDIIRPK